LVQLRIAPQNPKTPHTIKNEIKFCAPQRQGVVKEQSEESASELKISTEAGVPAL